jgi:sulfotransferase
VASTIHLISGLPRSGSTLLCAILRQNPRFAASMTSPVASLLAALMPKMSGGEFAVFFDDERRFKILRGLFDAYYADVPDGHVAFDTNRTWTARASLLGKLYPQCRIICCVRDVGWIIDSIERMLRKNPLQFSRLFNFQPGASIYSRAEILMNSETGLIGLAWASLREAWFSENAHRQLIVQYESLVQKPEAIIGALYRELGEAPYAHDFDSVAYDEPNYDALLGMPGMHKVRERVDFQKRDSCIPPDILAKYSDASFWLRSEANHRNVRIL